MLRIGKKDKDIQIKEILDKDYTDITSVSMWIGVVEKYNFSKIESEKQIELFIKNLGDNIDNYNKVWYESYKNKNY